MTDSRWDTRDHAADNEFRVLPERLSPMRRCTM